MAHEKNTDMFDPARIRVVNNAVETAEDLVSNHYKLSASQWLGRRYDVKTAVDLEPGEIIHEEGHFAQLMRYEGQPRDGSLGSTAYDLYRICLQDHTILAALDQNPDLPLFPFCLYIVIHELVHIVRFSEFLQIFEASREEKMAEEMRVHAITHEILEGVKVSGLSEVLDFYKNWRVPIDEVGSS